LSKVKEDSPKAHHFTRQSLWKVNVERKVVHGDFDQWQKDMLNLGWSVSSGISWSRQPEFPDRGGINMPYSRAG